MSWSAVYATSATSPSAVWRRRSILTLKLGKPLLLEGEAGVGKTEIAKVLADVLQTPLIRLQCYEGLDAATAIYEWDYPRQMLYLRTVEATGGESRQAVRHDLFSEEFLLKRPLLQAIDAAHERAPVLLIDEVDRADQELEAFLLELLSDFQVTVPEIGTHPRRARPGGDPHLEPHARDPRRAQAALPLPLDRLPGL